MRCVYVSVYVYVYMLTQDLIYLVFVRMSQSFPTKIQISPSRSLSVSIIYTQHGRCIPTPVSIRGVENSFSEITEVYLLDSSNKDFQFVCLNVLFPYSFKYVCCSCLSSISNYQLPTNISSWR